MNDLEILAARLEGKAEAYEQMSTKGSNMSKLENTIKALTVRDCLREVYKLINKPI